MQNAILAVIRVRLVRHRKSRKVKMFEVSKIFDGNFSKAERKVVEHRLAILYNTILRGGYFTLLLIT